MEQENKPYVFISYAHMDNEIVLPLLKGLQQRGISLWYDDGIEPATEWEEYIGERVANCTRMLVFLSQHTVESENCRDEMSLAKRYKKKVLVVYLKPEKQIKLSYYWELTTTNKQAMFMDRSPDQEKFLDRLADAKILKPCRIQEEAPAGQTPPAKEAEAAPVAEVAPVAEAPSGETVEITEPVREGEPEGMFQMAVSCEERAFDAKDWEQEEALRREAAQYYRKAADAGHGEAMYRLALCYYRGRGVDPDYREAFYWAIEGQYRQHTEATYLAAMFYEQGIGTEQNASRAVSAYIQAATQGHVDACLRLANCYRNGIGCEQDAQMVKYWYETAAQRGSGEGMLKAADLYAEDGMKLDAFTWYQRAASKNCVARYKLAMCHLTAFGTPEDRNNAYRLLGKVAEFGTPDVMPDACFQLARFQEDYGDHRAAAHYYHRAAALGCRQAYEVLQGNAKYRRGLRFVITRSRYQKEKDSYRPIVLPWMEKSAV